MIREVTVEFSEPFIKQAILRFWLRSIGLWGFSALGLTLLMLIYFVVHGDWRWFTWVVATIVGLAAIWLPLTYLILLNRSLSLLGSMTAPKAIFRFTDEGMFSQSELGTATVKWRIISQIWQYPEMWLIFFTSTEFITLPPAGLDIETRNFILAKVRAHGGKIA